MTTAKKKYKDSTLSNFDIISQTISYTRCLLSRLSAEKDNKENLLIIYIKAVSGMPMPAGGKLGLLGVFGLPSSPR